MIKMYTPKNYPEGNWRVSDGPVIPYLSIKEATPLNKLIMRAMCIGGAKWKDETINCFKILARLKHIDIPYFLFFILPFINCLVISKRRKRNRLFAAQRGA